MTMSGLALALQACAFTAGAAAGAAGTEALHEEGYEITSPIKKHDKEKKERDERESDHQMDAYELRDSVDLIKAGYSASMADALARYKGGDPIFFYTWTPNWTVGLLEPGKDVVWLQVKETLLPPDQAALKDAAMVKGVTGCAGDPCNMGMPANDIRPVVNSEFLDANPAVRALLENVRIPVQDIFAQNAEMNQGADSADDLERQATEWITANQGKVDSWLAEARAAAG
jgi:glycine betaine/proline transport system substrate-binding protein